MVAEVARVENIYFSIQFWNHLVLFHEVDLVLLFEGTEFRRSVQIAQVEDLRVLLHHIQRFLANHKFEVHDWKEMLFQLVSEVKQVIALSFLCNSLQKNEVSYLYINPPVHDSNKAPPNTQT